MNKINLILITGEPGAGKTTLSRFFSNAGFPVVHTSAIFKMALLKKLIPSPQSGNKFAPQEADEFIISAIRSKLLKIAAEGQKQLVVETFPRTVEQFQKLSELIPSSFKADGVEVTPTMVFLKADGKLRIARMQGRSDGRKKFDKERGFDDVENERLLELVEGLQSDGTLENTTADSDRALNGAKLLAFDTERFGPGEIMERVTAFLNLRVEKLAGAMNSATNGYYERSGYIGKIDCNRMIDRVIEECEELREEIKKSGIQSRESHFEFADIMHFIFCLADGLGIAPDRFLESFQQKTEINQARLHFNVNAENKHKIVSGDLLNGGIPKDE